MLRSEGYERVIAANGADGLTRARACLPDVILLDVMMPGLDSFEACRWLRTDPELAEVPILPGMEERVRPAEGELEICSASGRGTEVTVTIPIKT